MNRLELFLLTEVKETGRFKDVCNWNIEDIANAFLKPLRVLWHGRKVQIVRTLITGNLEEIHHVASFHPKGKEHVCRTNNDLCSSQSDWVLTTLAIICLIPGLLIGIPLKMIAHAWEGPRENYKLMKDHFSTIPVDIGSEDAPVSEFGEDLAFETAKRDLKPFNQKVSHLIVHGDGELILTARGAFIERINPKKIILIGASLFRGAAPSAWRHPLLASQDAYERIIDQGREIATGEFLPALVESGKFELEEDQPKVYLVKSVEEANKHRPPARANGKPYHALYLA